MIKRDIEKILRQRASEFPVITVTGPRQSGKTTLVRNCFPKHTYVNLEDPETRELAETDYKRFFTLYKPPIIVDEIQRVPRLASVIQTLWTRNGGSADSSFSRVRTSRSSRRPSPSPWPGEAHSSGFFP